MSHPILNSKRDSTFYRHESNDGVKIVGNSKKLDSFDFMYSIFKEATTSGLAHH